MAKMISVKNITPNMEGWLGEVVDVCKETENGIPTGRTSITWVSDTGRISQSSYEREAFIEIL